MPRVSTASSAPPGRLLPSLVAGWLSAVLWAGDASPQDASGAPVLSGEVLIGDEPADSGTVVLHRVSALFTGEVDSVSVGRTGAFRLPLPAVPDPERGDVFFASVRYQNVLYFGEAIIGAADLEGTYVIQAYPTVGAGPGISLPIRVRNIFAERADPGPGWAVTDLFELHNDTRATLVASEDGATWSHALPPGAVDFQVGQSDLPAGAASFGGGRVHVSAPVPPGESVYLIRYGIPDDDFTVPLDATTGSMELLVREPAGELSVAGLAALDPVEMEGATYRRFAGRDMAASVITVARGQPLTPSSSVPLVAVFLALALAAAGALLAGRARSRPAARAGDLRRRVLVEIARLDEEWGAGGVDVEDYDRRRGRLLKELDP